MNNTTRRHFLHQAALGTAGTIVLPSIMAAKVKEARQNSPRVPISGHVWVYASNYPPHWDCTPILEQVFKDFQFADLDGVELMEGQLRHADAVARINNYIATYGVPVTGSSYGVGFGMWDNGQHKDILTDIAVVVPRLAEVGGKTFGISVGNKKEGAKTEAELDAQAEVLLKIRQICQENGIEANLHNHTYEVENGMHDLRGTLERIPDFKLGPDLNWLIRAKIDPVAFIHEFGPQLVYLHIRDQYQDGTWTEYVGQGVTDFKSISAALKAQNFNGRAAVELAFPNDFTPKYPLRKDWKKSKRFVQRTFGWS